MARLQRLTTQATQSQSSRSSSTLSTQHRLTTLRTDLERLESIEQLTYLLEMLVRDAHAHAGHLYVMRQGRAARCVASHETPASDAALDAQVEQHLQRLMAADSEHTRSVESDAAFDNIQRELPNREREAWHAVALRGSTGGLHGIALLRAADGSSAAPHTEGLCTIAADVLAQLLA